MPSRPQLWLDRLAIAYLTFLLLWLLLRGLWFDRFFVLAMLNLGALYLLLPLAIALPYAIWRKRWLLLTGFMIPLAFALHGYGPLFLPSFLPTATPLSETGIPLKVMTFNVLWGNRDYDAIARSIRTESPDIIGFQELSSQHMPELVARLGQDYPYHVVHPSHEKHTVGVLSRIALDSAEAIADPPVNRGLRLSLSLDNQPLTLLVTHLAPPLSPTEILQKGPRTWAAISRQNHLARRAQVEEIRAIVTSTPEPLLMLCDCNLTSTTETYEALGEVLSDSFAERGWGLGLSFLAIAKRLPIQRLDYVWYSSQITATAAHIGPAGNSDHLPLVAQLKVQVE